MFYKERHFLLFALVIACLAVAQGLPYDKKDKARDSSRISFDEYPMVVTKRAAMLLDRIMVALHHALEDGGQDGNRKVNDVFRDGRFSPKSSSNSFINGKAFQSSVDKTGLKAQDNRMHPDEITDNDAVYEIPNDYEARELFEDNQIQRERGQLASDDATVQRRGHENLGTNNGRVYWRCYFNAVSCF